MAIAIVNLGASTGTGQVNPDIRNVTDATSYANSSWTPPSTGIVIAVIFSGQNTVTDTTVDSCDQNGVAFTRIGTDLQFSSGQRRISVFACYASSLSTGVFTVNYGTDLQLFTYVSFFQITGADESGAVTGAFTVATGTSGTGTASSLTYAAAADSNNRPMLATGHAVNEAETIRASWTKIDDMNGSGPALGFLTQWRSDTFETTGSSTWTTSGAWGAWGAEIKVASAGPPAPPPPQMTTMIHTPAADPYPIRMPG